MRKKYTKRKEDKKHLRSRNGPKEVKLNYRERLHGGARPRRDMDARSGDSKTAATNIDRNTLPSNPDITEKGK
jgi:hypothetical protein